MKIVITDGFALNPGDLDWGAIMALGEVMLYDRTDEADIVTRCSEAEIVVTNKVPFSRTTLQQLPALKFIAVTATGYNIIDVQAAREMGIVVSNIPAYSTDSVAQSVMALLLSVTNRVEHYTQQVTTEKRWSNNPDFCYWDTQLTELAGKQIGIYGFGRIGQQVATLARAFGMHVVAHTSKSQSQLPSGIEKREGEAFWQHSDIISLHCPLTPDTLHLVNAQTLSMMKPSCILLNTSRGPLVDDEAVANALHEGRLGAYAADVMTQEPPTPDNPLLGAPRVFITPHIAWATHEARTRLMNILTDNIRNFLQGNPSNQVS